MIRSLARVGCIAPVGISPEWSAVTVMLLALGCALGSTAAEPAWREIPAAGWKGSTNLELPALKQRVAAVVAYPVKEAQPLVCTTAAAVPAGLYEVRVTLRPSHVASAFAFNSGVRVKQGDSTAATFPGQLFARMHQPEARTFQCVQGQPRPLLVTIEAFTDAKVCEQQFTAAKLRTGGPKEAEGLDERKGGDDLEGDLELALSPASAVYYVVDRVEFRPLSHSGHVVKVTRNKIRYAPGETLKGSVVVADAGGRGGSGTLNLYLEHGVRDRRLAKSVPVQLRPEPQAIAVELPLPKTELGYALVAEFVSADGADHSEAAEYLSIAANFNRVYIAAGGSGGHGSTKVSEGRMRQSLEQAMAGYGNAQEHFAWAEEDMVAMSPDTDYWFSGQTCYHISKKGLQQYIRLAHEYGIAQVSYAKFIMSGYLGWKTAYDYPNDHKSQYFYPVGMWEGVDNVCLDRFRNKEFLIYENTPGRVGDNPFYVWWAAFLPINPDPTPHMARIAAEEVARSADMFGWDGIRWDGHPRGGGQCGGSGSYDALAARRTQTLVRYFKDIVGAKYPMFGHGYNYLMIENTPSYDWAYEDFELDELCRGGGLIMNESIGNATPGPFSFIARNLQVEGDLVRERGGYYLGISFAMGPRDELVEGALWAAAGARPYNGGCNLEVRRYLTRYSQYSLDENLRRLDKPEKVLAPQAETKLWWQPFVYETPLENGRRQLVVNLLNLPLQETRTPEKDKEKPKYAMLPGTDPVTFALTLPEGIKAKGATLIDPYSLAVTPVPLKENRLEVPAVAVWLVAVVDLSVDAGAPALASLYGAPKTFGVPRPGRKSEPKPEVRLDTAKEVWEVNKDMTSLAPDNRRQSQDEQAALDNLPWDERNAKVLARREQNPAQKLIDGWWKGGTLPEDLKLKEKKFEFGDLAPQRNGRFDIYHGRGAIDDRLRLPTVFAGLPRFAVHDAPLGGSFRAGGGQWLGNGVDWRRYPAFDLLLYTGIPHCAIGPENSYGLVDYVKAGGAVLFTGGEYAFGKGGYNHTVLERELLPVVCVENLDTRYTEQPLPLEPGKDFAELKVNLDFAAKPAFWVWNQVALKNDAGIKVFLKSGNRPLLVGWQLGKGRVACLLLDHRGKSEKDVTAFFDWKDWPDLMRAVFAWLAPEAMKVVPPPPSGLTAAEARRLLDDLEGGSLEDGLALLDQGGDDGGAGATAGGASRELSGAALKKRVEIISRIMCASGKDVAAVLAEQLATVSTLPAATRYAMLDFIRSEPPPDLAETGRRCLGARESIIRGTGLQFLAIAGDSAFAKEMTGPVPEMETDQAARGHELALALVLFGKPDLATEGKRRVAAWNAAELKAKNAYTGGPDFSLAAPEGPLLDKDTLFQRVAWLAYLSRHEPRSLGAQFAREWLMTRQYEDYADRTLGNIWSDKQATNVAKNAKAQPLIRIRAEFARLRRLTQPDLEALLKAQPDLVADGFSRAHFTLEFRAAMNLLGNLDAAAGNPVLTRLVKAANPDLAAFAAARLAP